MITKYSDFLKNSKENSSWANRIPCPSQTVKTELIGSTGLDFLKVSFWIDWHDLTFKNLLADLKEGLQGSDDQSTPVPVHSGLHANLQRTSAGGYAYVLKCGDVTLLFSNHKHDAPFPNCRLEIGSVSCWNPGAYNIYDSFKLWLSNIDGKIVHEKITEAHLTADLLGANFEDLFFTDLERWIRRSTKFSLQGEGSTYNYISLGRGDLMVRLYNKSKQLKEHAAKQTAFFDYWYTETGSIYEHVTRIEFQVRRPILKEMGIQTVKDFRENSNRIWIYLTSEWSKFSSSNVDRDNQDRSVIDPLWFFVQSLRFFEPSADEESISRKKPILIDIDKLKKQAIGVLLTVCAALGSDPSDFFEHKVMCNDIVTEQITLRIQDIGRYESQMRSKYNLSITNLS